MLEYIQDEEEEEEDDMEAVVKGKSTSLAAFYRLSRNLLLTVFRWTKSAKIWLNIFSS